MGLLYFKGREQVALSTKNHMPLSNTSFNSAPALLAIDKFLVNNFQHDAKEPKMTAYQKIISLIIISLLTVACGGVEATSTLELTPTPPRQAHSLSG